MTTERDRQIQVALGDAAGNLALLRGNVAAMFDRSVEERLQAATDVPTRIAEIDMQRGEVVIERSGVRYRVRVDREDGLV